MMCSEAGVDERKLVGLRIEHGNLAARSFGREQLRRRMVRSLLAESRILVRADSAREPGSSLLIHHRVMSGGLAIPNRLISPIRRGGHGIGFRCARLRIADWNLDLAHLVVLRVQN